MQPCSGNPCLVRAQGRQGRKVAYRDPAPCGRENALPSQPGQLPCDLYPAHAKDVRNILLGHFDDETRVGRLMHCEQIQQVAQLHPG